MTPLAILDGLWVGASMLGLGLGADAVFAVGGVALFLSAAVPVLLLAAVPGIWRGSRGPALPAAVGVVAVAVLVTGPLHTASVLSWLPAGRVLVVLVAVTTLLSLLLSRRRAEVAGGSPRVPALAAIALGALLIGAGFLAASSDGIPMAPSGLLASDFEGSADASGERLRLSRPYDRPGLAPGQGSNIHHDPAMSDLYVGRRALDPSAADVVSFRAPGDCGSILFDRRERMIAVCVGGTSVRAYVLDPLTLEPLAERRVGGRSPFAGLTSFAGGGYAALDSTGRVVLGADDGIIKTFRIRGRQNVRILRGPRFSVDNALAEGEKITSVLPDSRRRTWFVGTEGTIGVLDPVTRRKRTVGIESTQIENSFALAPNGDALVVTSGELLRLRARRGKPPRVIWREEYDRGERTKPGQTARGSGTTPTIMLDGRFVAITDNAEPRMNVLVYDARPRSRGRRLVCRVPVFESSQSATENSLIAAGSSLFVENNYGYRAFEILGGHSSEPGVARIDVNRDQGGCGVAWENDDVHVPSVVSKVSAADGTFLTYTRPPSALGIDAWYFTALDAGTGEVLWKRKAGSGPLANNHYAALYLGSEGQLYVGTLGGVIGLVRPSS